MVRFQPGEPFKIKHLDAETIGRDECLQDSGIELEACDLPCANRMTVGAMALVAEQEAADISERAREALAARSARGPAARSRHAQA